MKEVPRIISKKTFTKPDKILFFDILPNAIGKARGIANNKVNANTSSEVTEPSNIAKSIFLKFKKFIKIIFQ